MQGGVGSDIGDDEIYSAIPGAALEKIAEALETIASANIALAQYHQGRCRQLATA